MINKTKSLPAISAPKFIIWGYGLVAGSDFLQFADFYISQQ